MNKLNNKIKLASSVVSTAFTALFLSVNGVFATDNNIIINTAPSASGGLGFRIPNLSDVLTFVVRFFFIIAGLMALLYLLLGALAWVTSGGSKEGVEKAREKIQAAIIGVILIVIVLAIIYTLEQVVFGGKICFGISCPLSIPSLIQPT